GSGSRRADAVVPGLRRDVVVVAGEVEVDLAQDRQAGRGVEAARRDADRLAAARLPEEARAALRAERATRVRDAVRTVDPPHRVGRRDDELLPRRRGRGPDVAAPRAALGAVADDDVAEGAVDLEPDGAAEPASGRAGAQAGSATATPGGV